IINVSSLAGYTTAGPYAASKSWVTVFTESLAMELKGTGVSATALLPGFVQTEFHERAAMNMEGLPRITWLKAPFVVEQALKDAAKGTVLSIPSVKYRTAGEFSRIAPRPLVRALTSPDWFRRFRQRAVTRSSRRASRRTLHAPRDLAVVRGRVTLSSGAEADHYVDLRRVTLHHEAAPLVGRVMLELLRQKGLMPGVEAVGGLTLGADPVATAMLHASAADATSGT